MVTTSKPLPENPARNNTCIGYILRQSYLRLRRRDAGQRADAGNTGSARRLVAPLNQDGSIPSLPSVTQRLPRDGSLAKANHLDSHIIRWQKEKCK